MNKENETDCAIFSDVSSFHAIDRGQSGGLSRFIQTLDEKLAKNHHEFQQQIHQLNRGVSVSSENEKILIKKIQSLQYKLESVEQENYQLERLLHVSQDERNQMEKKIVLLSNEISRLKHSKITSLNSRRTAPVAQPSTSVDIDKYRRALLYIDELQHRLRG